MSNQGMIRSRQGSFNFVYRLIDLSIIFSGLFFAAAAYGVNFSPIYTTISLVAAVAFMLCAESLGLYRSWRASTQARMLFMTTATWWLSAMFVLLLGFFAKISSDISRVVIGGWIVVSWFSLMGWRLVFRQVLRAMRARGYNSRSAAIVGLNDSALRMRDQIISAPDLGIRFSGFFDDRCVQRLHEEHPDEVLLGSINELIEQAKQGKVDLIFIALPLKAQKRISHILERCGDTTASVHLIPDFFTYNLLHARMGSVGSVETLSIYETPILGFNDFLKRSFDVVFSGLILCLIALPMLVIAAAVKFTSPGPVIFKQARYGLDGKKIFVWKFRSMSTMDNGEKVVQATKGDARITKVGAFIRKTSLDELPQFINVLQGRMSVVGPRPHAVAHNEEYRKLIPYYMLRHKVKPGITGWAQINGFRGETDTLDKMEGRIDHDLDYIRNWSLFMDVKIIILTIFKGFVGGHVH
ncbi:MAG: putative colanic acid biosynthesis UDP-glucose lipid carrier transferase [Oleispira sp.]|jgi:putative colanic acid biosynthesis UDP-glucose lipid carrier transferase